ncbi:MAG: hypothetical protein AVDCRST_MAG51-1363 [uncultured Ramlibacter sp.]|uniref:Uncharacterized protein n=1 Tax=uncultured Ramlibacter sp. TaxID=260755 RepID=A0A6J4PC35_9BURK|nr:MAG: hypothetical protein AVDCRST_MAG51-1363 [uncultured Ramlibacter sp.]
MTPWKAALREGAVSGSLASLFSSCALTLSGRRENGRGAAPTNATSQWLWGREALRRNRTDGRHTVTGYLIHHAASTLWAVIHARVLSDRPEASRPGTVLAAAAATASVAALVDFKFTPRRLSPGFEHRLSRPALVATYACFAAGLALGSLAVRRRRQRAERQGVPDSGSSSGAGLSR